MTTSVAATTQRGALVRLAVRSGKHKSTLSRIFAGERIPSRELAEIIVAFCREEGIVLPEAGARVIAAVLEVPVEELLSDLIVTVPNVEPLDAD